MTYNMFDKTHTPPIWPYFRARLLSTQSLEASESRTAKISKGALDTASLNIQGFFFFEHATTIFFSPTITKEQNEMLNVANASKNITPSNSRQQSVLCKLSHILRKSKTAMNHNACEHFTFYVVLPFVTVRQVSFKGSLFRLEVGHMGPKGPCIYTYSVDQIHAFRKLLESHMHNLSHVTDTRGTSKVSILVPKLLHFYHSPPEPPSALEHVISELPIKLSCKSKLPAIESPRQRSRNWLKHHHRDPKDFLEDQLPAPPTRHASLPTNRLTFDRHSDLSLNFGDFQPTHAYSNTFEELEPASEKLPANRKLHYAFLDFPTTKKASLQPSNGYLSADRLESRDYASICHLETMAIESIIQDIGAPTKSN